MGDATGSADVDTASSSRGLRSRLLQAGTSWASNFPVAANPALPRGLGVMLKLDFQPSASRRWRAGDRVWRDLLLVADEYHAFATVGETHPRPHE